MAASAIPSFFDDHQSIRPRLRALERALDAAMNRNHAEAADLAVVRASIAFLRADGFDHLRREEAALLPVLEAKVGRAGTLVSVIAYDHDEIRREVGKLAEALAAVEAKGGEPHAAELRELNRHGIFLVQYMALHMAKEDAFLAEGAREALGEDGLEDVARRLEGMR